MPDAMRRVSSTLLALLLLAGTAGLIGCSDDLRDDDFTLLDQHGRAVDFPAAFEDRPVVMSFVYTNCPDICPMITARLKQVESQLTDVDDVAFVLVSFDPERDTPEVLDAYARSFGLNGERWTLLTGEDVTVETFMERLGIVVQRSFTRQDDRGNPYYFIDHTDRVTVIDRDQRIRHEFVGSEVDPERLAEAVRTL